MRILAPCYFKHSKYLNIVAISLLTLFLSSCGPEAAKEFPLTIVVANKLGSNKSDKLPDNIVGLCQIMENCSKYNFVPVPTLKRIGGDGAELSLKTNITGGMAGNKNNPNLIRRQIDAHLRAMEITNIFATPNSGGIDLEAALGSYMGTVGNSAKVYYFSDNPSGDSYKGNKIFNDLDSLRSAITKQLCEEPPAPVLIVFNPLTTTITAGATPSGTSTPNDTSKNDEAIKSLHEENFQAKSNPALLQAVDTKIKNRTDSKDYRFIFERVKNRIYGGEHHEAFSLLEEAAMTAIENGQAASMFRDINEDKEGDLKKLSHGHPKQWNPIYEALENNDREVLVNPHKPHHKH